MARRSKQSIDAGTAFLLAAIVAVAVIANLAISLFSVALMWSPYYWFLLLVTALFYSVVRIARPPPNFTATDLFSGAELNSLLDAQAEQRWLFEEKVRLHAEARRQSIWTRRSEPTRFDERKSNARAMNQMLDRLDRQYQQLGARTYEIRTPVIGRLHTWKHAVRGWNKRVALLAGTQWALLCYVATAVVVAALQPASIQNISTAAAGSLTVKSTAFALIYGPLVIAFPVSLVVGGVGAFINHRRLDSRFDGEGPFNERWVHERMPPFHDYANFVGDAEHEQPGENSEPDNADDRDEKLNSRTDDGRSCYEILGINPDATAVEIKRAYGVRIKEYHPDHVARMGPRVIEAAERETKLINAARTEALRQTLRQSLSRGIAKLPHGYPCSPF